MVPLMIGGTFVGLVKLTGLSLSTAGWVAIARSESRLYGLWLAIPGALIPLLSILLNTLFRLRF